jgi:hypothetical protein
MARNSLPFSSRSSPAHHRTGGAHVVTPITVPENDISNP